MSTLLGKILADFSTSLSTDIAVGATTATLASATDDDGVALPSGRYFFTLDGSNSSKEHISCDLSGTSLTNIKSVSRQGVETTGAVRKHRIGTTVTLTDFAHLKFINDLISGLTTLNASAPLGYDGAITPTGNQLATATWVLGVVNGGTVTFDQQIVGNQTSGEALTINDIVYFKESDQRWWKADADLTATFDQLQLGINKTTAGSAGTTIQIAISGPVSGFSSLTPGSKYYLSNTAGGISTSAGTYSVFVGWALSATILLFDPVLKTLPTQKEKDAMGGSTGTPSSTNKFVTQDSQSFADVDQSQTTQNGTVEVGEADSTTKKNIIAQSFIPAKSKIRGVKLYKSADTGTFTGSVVITLQADTTGSPSGTPLATATLTNAQWNALSVGEFQALFAAEYSGITTGSLYWIVIDPSTSDNSNHPNLGTNTSGGYASGSVKYKNTTDSWVAIATIDIYFKTLEGTIAQSVKTDATGKIPQAFFDVTKMPIPAYQQIMAVSQEADADCSIAGCASNQDGSILIIRATNLSSGGLQRWVRDSKTGHYFKTHDVTSNLTNLVSVNCLVIVGDYVYGFYDAGANQACYRYDLATLANETSMTFGTSVASGGSNDGCVCWTDGKYIYLIVEATNTVCRKLSISGTNFTQESTATVDADLDDYAGGKAVTFFDGTTAYVLFDNGSNDIKLLKLVNIDGSDATIQTLIVDDFSDGDAGSILVNIDTDRFYLGFGFKEYDEAAQTNFKFTLLPKSKP